MHINVQIKQSSQVLSYLGEDCASVIEFPVGAPDSSGVRLLRPAAGTDDKAMTSLKVLEVRPKGYSQTSQKGSEVCQPYYPPLPMHCWGL